MLTRPRDQSQGGLPIGDTNLPTPPSDPAARSHFVALAERGTPPHIEPMEASPADRRKVVERRARPDRRHVAVVVPIERRAGSERRGAAPRRAPESVGEHIRNALQLLTNVAESGTLDEESLRDLDAAMFRLRFALDRFEADR